MTQAELVEVLDEYKMGLLSKATDGTIDDKYYIQTRNTLMETASIKAQISRFIKSCRTADERRRESSVEEALIEMYLAGVSVRRVEDITEAL